MGILFLRMIQTMAVIVCVFSISHFNVAAEDRIPTTFSLTNWATKDESARPASVFPSSRVILNDGDSRFPQSQIVLTGFESPNQTIPQSYPGVFSDVPPGPNCVNNQVFGNGQQYVVGQQYGQSQTTKTGKTGTAMDSLPSFRGIKGIKNLPGGVGTILMANPHVGTTWYPEQNVDQSGKTLSMERYYFQGAVPVYHTDVDTVLFTAHLDATSIHTNAILPTSLQTFPTQLFNIAFGANYFHQFEGGNVGGFVFDMGTASDKPFESSRDLLASGTGFLLMPQDDRNAWFVGVNASTNSQVLYGIPIPGGGYFYNPSDDFQAIVGFPFSVVSWKPIPDWQLQYVYAFLTTMHARAVYQPTQQWQLYAGFDWTNENWRRAERTNAEDHFFYYEKKLAAGWLWWFNKNVGAELSGGWAFDRYFTEVHGFKLTGDNTVHIGSGPFLSAQIDVRF